MRDESCNRSSRAFSLVETVVAIGVVSFSVLATIGLLSIGSDTSKRAKDESAAARLTANEFERLRSLSSASFSNYYPTYPQKYYDSNFAEIQNGPTAIYQLNIAFTTGPMGTADVVANAEVRYPARAPVANQSVHRFTTLMNIPSP
jgi:uncharacterized protein (TIGR02598 family)